MNYWDGKCFFCIFWGTLIAIIGLSAKPIYMDIKNGINKGKKKNKVQDTASSKNGISNMFGNPNQEMYIRYKEVDNCKLNKL